MALPPSPRSAADAAQLNLPRRKFLQRCITVATATGLPVWMVASRLAAGAESAARAVSPLNRPHIALVGCGGMGKGDAGNASHHGDVVAVCDVDAEHGAAAVEELTKDGKSPELLRDFREVMARDDIDVIVNATPDHWHTLVNLAAVKAGKDIYAEKPLTLTIDEGRLLADAVEARGVVLQTGTQQRSSLRFSMAKDLVDQGRIGKLQRIEVWLPAGLHDGPFAAAAAPDHLNWDFWQGPTHPTSYVKERVHQNFRFWYDYSGGTMTDWGAHHIDIAKWISGDLEPVKVAAKVFKQPVPGGYTAISDYEVRYTLQGGLPVVVRTTPDSSIYGITLNPAGQLHGVKLIGEDGWIWVTRSALEASSPAILRRDPESEHSHRQIKGDHMTDFFDCVHSREATRCPAEVGHRSASMCHLGVIALQLNKGKLTWDPESEKFTRRNAGIANNMRGRPMRAPFDLSFVG